MYNSFDNISHCPVVLYCVGKYDVRILSAQYDAMEACVNLEHKTKHCTTFWHIISPLLSLSLPVSHYSLMKTAQLLVVRIVLLNIIKATRAPSTLDRLACSVFGQLGVIHEVN